MSSMSNKDSWDGAIVDEHNIVKGKIATRPIQIAAYPVKMIGVVIGQREHLLTIPDARNLAEELKNALSRI